MLKDLFNGTLLEGDFIWWVIVDIELLVVVGEVLGLTGILDRDQIRSRFLRMVLEFKADWNFAFKALPTVCCLLSDTDHHGVIKH